MNYSSQYYSNRKQARTSYTATQTPLSSPPPKPNLSTKFGDVLAFSGPAPKRINGKLAMIGFVVAIGTELAQGNDVVAQLANGDVPCLMTSDAEMWRNGRFSMLGLVALVFTEFVTGSALV